MVASGLGVILISHKLNEILEISNRIIVLRSGEVVGKVKTKNADKTQLGEMIVGRKINRPIREKKIHSRKQEFNYFSYLLKVVMG